VGHYCVWHIRVLKWARGVSATAVGNVEALAVAAAISDGVEDTGGVGNE